MRQPHKGGGLPCGVAANSPWTYLAWLVALVATIGSLTFSEVLGLPPCALCWFQRIFMYPLAILLGLGLLRRDGAIPVYGLALALPGLAIAVWHNLVYVGVVPESLTPCVSGVSCSGRLLQVAGFVDIPQMSLAAFVIISGSLALAWRAGRTAA